jgi:hypothetical protein
MIQDLILEADDEGKPPPGPALVISATATNRELMTDEHVYRMRGTDLAAAGICIFTVQLEDGSEAWDEGEGERWMKLMNWPRIPSIDEATQWQSHCIARVEFDTWSALHGAKPTQD